MAAADRIDLNPTPAQSANAETSALAAEIARGGAPAGAAQGVAVSAEAAVSMWAAVPVMSTETEEQGVTVDAALAARGLNVATRNVEAVNAAIATDQDNGRALTPRQEFSV